MDREYRVVGMTCAHCVAAVTDEVARIPGVLAVQVELDGGTVRVTSDAPVPRPSMVSAVNEAGYELAP